MKNFLVFAFVLFSTLSFAQKGSWYIGGSGGFNSIKPDGGDAVSGWRLSPEVGTFLSDNIQLGGAINLFGGSEDSAEKGTGITLYGRYFFKPGEAFRPFVGAAIPYNSTSSKVLGTDFDTNSFGLNLNGGFGYALSDRWTVVGSLAVLGFTSNGGDAKYTELDFGFDTLGNPFNVGIYYTFKK